MALVKQRDVVPLIAGITRPNFDKRISHNSVRNRIARAISDKKLHKKPTKYNEIAFDETEFWDWAQTEWNLPNRLIGRPHIPSAGKSDDTLGASDTVSTFVIRLPHPDKIIEEYRSLYTNHHKTLEENKQLKQRITVLEVFEKKDMESRKKKSDAGKKGGRPSNN
ncbi:hypothetical protein [Cycloclasticus pugetii]|jgi:hypothetical protein|uniref:hypothetical protein n=1 Tax=Cycloclasticus pugetii TaxID=34068 RepID=UPI0009117B1A|nr:hypothetical protein [Cycloclasticus pugetii]SHJ32476.1 hypothetical protein SAMN05519226_1864 [Cycloclasticus pugetii]